MVCPIKPPGAGLLFTLWGEQKSGCGGESLVRRVTNPVRRDCTRENGW
jgi:hypothetical protein